MQETYLEMKSESIKFALLFSYPFVNDNVQRRGGFCWRYFINLKPYTVSYTRSFIRLHTELHTALILRFIKPDDPPRPALSRARA